MAGSRPMQFRPGPGGSPAAPGEPTPRRGEAGSPRPLLDGAGGVKMKWRSGSGLQTPRSALSPHLGSRGRRPGPLGGGGGTSQARPLLQGARRAEGRLPHPRAAGTAAPSRSRQLPARRGEEGGGRPRRLRGGGMAAGRGLR